MQTTTNTPQGIFTYIEGLDTDFYQLAMIFANVVLGKGNQRTGFEGFVRNIKKEVNPFTNFYIFDGKNEVDEFMSNLRNDIQTTEFRDTIVAIVGPKITAPNKDELIETFKKNWENLNFEFEYKVVENGTKVFPMIPTFQYNGSVVWGQLVETYVTNIYNGRTAFKTIEYLMKNGYDLKISQEDFNFLKNIMNGDEATLAIYEENLRERAIEFRDATSKVLLEAAFRRAPTKIIADMASRVAIEEGWQGTSNTGVMMRGIVKPEQVGGTMAHAFVMGFPTEREAFIAWDLIFPETTMLIDTYDTINAAKIIRDLIDDKIIKAPREIRIDSDPLDELSIEVNKILDGRVNVMFSDNNYVKNRIGTFVSGDMTPERLIEFEENNIPFTKTMAGTKFVYFEDNLKRLNSGFVYKIVEFTQDETIFYPEKKASGKSNYPGLKNVIFNENTNTITVFCKTPEFGVNTLNNISNDVKIVFEV